MSDYYNNARVRCWTTGNNLVAGDIRCLPVNTATGTVYTFNRTHSTLADIASGARINGLDSMSASLTSPAVSSAGVFSADDSFFPDVPVGAHGNVESFVVLEYNSGTPESSRLIAYIDDAEGFPYPPDGGNIPIIWHEDGIFEALVVAE